MKDWVSNLAYLTQGGIIVFGLSLQSWSFVFGILGVLGTILMNRHYKELERQDRLRFHEERLRIEEERK